MKEMKQIHDCSDLHSRSKWSVHNGFGAIRALSASDTRSPSRASRSGLPKRYKHTLTALQPVCWRVAIFMLRCDADTWMRGPTACTMSKTRPDTQRDAKPLRSVSTTAATASNCIYELSSLSVSFLYASASISSFSSSWLLIFTFSSHPFSNGPSLTCSSNQTSPFGQHGSPLHRERMAMSRHVATRTLVL